MSLLSLECCAELAHILVSIFFSENTSSLRFYFDLLQPVAPVPQLAARISDTAEPLTIRGASKLSRRKYAISAGSTEGVTRMSSARLGSLGTKVLDVWRDFVNRRWNAEARFLNLEVSHSFRLILSVWELITFMQRMMDDPELQKHNLLPPGVPGSTAREAAVIFKLASHLKPEVCYHLLVVCLLTYAPP